MSIDEQRIILRPPSASYKVLYGLEQRSDLIRTFLTYVFVVFLFYVFTDGALFQAREVSDLADVIEVSDQGDTVRQVFYLSVAAIFFAIAIRHGLSSMMRAIPLSLICLILWCALSSVWAITPSVSIRRVILATIIIFSTIQIVSLIGPVRITELMYKVLATLLIANYLSLILVPSLAIHSSVEKDIDLIGAWHGVMPHKNIASAVTALSCIFFGYRAYMTRSWLQFIYLILSIVFLIGTKGKTSLGFVVPCLVASVLYTSSYSMKGRRFFSFVIISLLLASSAIFIVFFEQSIENIFSNPDSFTGRVSIWEIVLRYAQDHLMTGAGFGSFWLIGNASPILTIGGDKPWLFGVAHSHNGYLEILVTTGLPGLALTLIALVALPFYRFFVADARYKQINGLYFGIWMFSVLYNLLETHIMNRDRQVWVIMLVAIEVCFLLHRAGGRDDKQQVRSDGA